MTAAQVDLNQQVRQMTGAAHRGPVCDFCAAALRRRWRCYGAEPFVRHFPWRGMDLSVHYTGHWAACRRCHLFVDTQDWRGLTARVVAVWEARRGELVIAREVFAREVAALLLDLERRFDGTSWTERDR